MPLHSTPLAPPSTWLTAEPDAALQLAADACIVHRLGELASLLAADLNRNPALADLRGQDQRAAVTAILAEINALWAWRADAGADRPVEVMPAADPTTAPTAQAAARFRDAAQLLDTGRLDLAPVARALIDDGAAILNRAWTSRSRRVIAA